MPDLTIRPIQPADYADWRRLWTAYLEFYETTVPDEVYDTTFKRLCDAEKIIASKLRTLEQQKT